jgi:hypothetical protein
VLKNGFSSGAKSRCQQGGLWDGGGWECVGEAMKITNTSRFLGHPLPALGRGEIQLFRNCLTSFYFGIFMQTAEQ